MAMRLRVFQSVEGVGQPGEFGNGFAIDTQKRNVGKRGGVGFRRKWSTKVRRK